MDTSENIVLKLNDMLEAEQFNLLQYDGLTDTMIKRFKFKIRLIDFEFYNEERRNNLRTEKIKSVMAQNFEYAAKMRDLELECLKYIQLKTLFGVEKSMFMIENKYLLYFCLGTSTNDTLIKERIMQDDGYVKLKIKIRNLNFDK